MFGLSAAKKYGGIYVPPHIAVIHQYMREMHAGCGNMILGSDSHTRYGALGTMAIGEGGGELVKQLLCDTYDVKCPEVVAIYLTGKPAPHVGPQDIALAIIGAVFKCGYVKNKVMEFVGPGIANLPLEYRSGIDVMTTETTCLSSIWVTDEKTQEYLAAHGRAMDYKPLAPAPLSYYDGLVRVDLSAVRPMIALPMHPSNVYTIEELCADPIDVLSKVGGLDIAGLTGVFLGGALCRVPVLIDGLISSVAALCAQRLSPAAQDYQLATHASAEPAGCTVLRELGLTAILHAGMRLGEGTGAVAVMPILDMALAIYRDMSTFQQMDIDAYEHLS